jgi:hypothetical protein
MLLPIDRTATTSHPFEANRTELTSLGAQAVLTGTSKSASSSNKSAFAGRLTGRSHSSQKSASTYIWLWKTVESDIYSGKILRKSVFRFTLGCSWTHFWEKMRNRTRLKKSPQGRPRLAISTTLIYRGPFQPFAGSLARGVYGCHSIAPRASLPMGRRELLCYAHSGQMGIQDSHPARAWPKSVKPAT